MKFVLLLFLVGLNFVGQTTRQEIEEKYGADDATVTSMRRAAKKRIYRELVRDLPPVSIVSTFGSEGEDGLNSRRLKTAVELRLRTHGIPVRDDLGTPSLGVQINPLGLGQNPTVWHASVKVFLIEKVVLKRNGYEFTTATWGVDDDGYALYMENEFEKWRDVVLERVDAFCNDYLAANATQKP